MTDTFRPTVPGFRFAGIAAGIKKTGALDLGLIVADEPTPCAAVFTKNLVRAAPVELSADRLAKTGGKSQALLVNSGNANACTGKPGMAAAKTTTEAVAKELGIAKDLVLPSSTGVIGQVLPAETVVAALPKLVAALSHDATDFAHAILTTDRGPKVAAVEAKLDRSASAQVLGIAKGAGMIHPQMATTLAYVVTDARVAPPFLKRVLRAATERTFNSASVDGETSTNDTILLLASGRSGGPLLRGGDKPSERFEAAITEVLDDLARMIVADGEGAEHLVNVVVSGAPSEAAAKKVAERVARSMLVKTALHGKDANWGRILAAAGMAGVPFDPTKIEIRVNDVTIVRRGLGVGAEAEKKAHELMRRPEYTLELKLGAGRARASYLTCDLGHEYIRINADYRS